MNRGERRALERGVRKITEKDGDHCSVCRRALEHADETFYGAVKKDLPAVVGVCCRAKLTLELGCGVYLNRSLDAFSPRPNVPRGNYPRLSPDEAVATIRKHARDVDAYTADVLSQGGVKGKGTLGLADTPWKADDAAWFNRNPGRAHRLRDPHPGELATLNVKADTMPDRHEMQVLVRQLSPGKRLRIPFGRNIDADVSDDEAVIHALFDIAAGRKGGVIDKGELAVLAQRYRPEPGSKLN